MKEFLLIVLACSAAVVDLGAQQVRSYTVGQQGVYQFVSFWKKPRLITHDVQLSDSLVLETNGNLRYPNGFEYRLRPTEIVNEKGIIGRRTRFMMYRGQPQEYTWEKGVADVLEDVWLSNGDVLKVDGTILHPDGRTEKLQSGQVLYSSGELVQALD